MGVKRGIRGVEVKYKVEEGRDKRERRGGSKNGLKGEGEEEEERGKRGKKKGKRGGGALRLDVTCLSD